MIKLVTSVVALFITVSASAQTKYVIKGSIPPSNKAISAVMSYPPDDKGGEYISDTTMIVDGKFEFKGAIARPQLAEINLIMPRKSDVSGRKNESSDEGNSMRNVGLLYLDGKINLSFDDSGTASSRGGGKTQKAWQYYITDATEKNKIEENLAKGFDFFQELIYDFVKRYPDNYVSIDLMDFFTQSSIQPSVVEPMYNALSRRMKNSEKVLSWIGKLEKAKLALTGTVLAPAFTMNDTQGNPVSLDSYRGQYVLIDFWASWCVPCREENPNVLAAYENYKDKNFTILAVSLDTKKDLWLKAIKEDNLPWTQLCDFKATASEVTQLYEISSIPANVLVDKNGFIIGKDLRGQALHDKLAEVLDK